MSRERVGFVGLGRMGYEMARHLSGAGFDVHGVDVDAGARQRAGGLGIAVSASIEDLAGVPVVLSSLPDTPEASDVYRRLLPLLEPGSLCVDLSTISVETSQTLAATAREWGIEFLDAPVSGTSTHAAAGSLAVMVGGEETALDRARRHLESFSSSIHHCGPNGAGLEMKLVTNRLLTAHLVAIAEAIAELEAAGLDVQASLDLLRAGAVPRLLDYKSEPMASRDYTPMFTVDLMAKDLGLADERRPAGAVTRLAAGVMRKAQATGFGSQDIAAVMAVVARTRADRS